MRCARAPFALVLLAALAMGASLAQEPALHANEAAARLAERLGGERNIEGLAAILQARNADLLGRYHHGFRQGWREKFGTPLPEAVEALIVGHYPDRALRPALRPFLTDGRMPHRSVALFDMLMDEWRLLLPDERDAYDVRRAALNTIAMGIEPRLQAWLEAPDRPGDRDAATITAFLEKRRQAAALAAQPAAPAASPQAPRSEEYAARRAAIEAQGRPDMLLRSADPAKYLAAARARLAALEALQREYPDVPHPAAGLRSDFGPAYLDLAHLARFRLSQHAVAIEMYEAAWRHGNPLGRLGIADMAQFDLRDRARALREYRGMLRDLEAAGPRAAQEAAAAAWARRWLSHQVAYLETGRRFGGKLGAEDLEAAPLLVLFGHGSPGNELGIDARDLESPERLAARLQALPASAFSLLRASAVFGMLEDDAAILSLLERLDPAGYASAVLLGAARKLGRESPALERARARFFAERRIVAD